MIDIRGADKLNQAYLLLGSNIEPARNLKYAVQHLARFGDVRALSAVWESHPAGFTSQPRFLNAAVLLETRLSAHELRNTVIATIEAALGRVRTANKNSPRTIDIDIMLFNRDVIEVGHRHIPDPEVRERPFAAIPLAEIAPGYVHPETGETLREIAHRFDPAAVGMRRRDDVALPSASDLATVS